MVDPVFRDQFEIGKSTPRYASLLSSLPDVFIGPFENLTRLVLFLCAEMATSFAEAEGGCVGVLPPWRLPGSMLSKWRPHAHGSSDGGSGQHGGHASSSVPIGDSSAEGWSWSSTGKPGACVCAMMLLSFHAAADLCIFLAFKPCHTLIP